MEMPLLQKRDMMSCSSSDNTFRFYLEESYNGKRHYESMDKQAMIRLLNKLKPKLIRTDNIEAADKLLQELNQN
jgi:hypothetical protein